MIAKNIIFSFNLLNFKILYVIFMVKEIVNYMTNISLLGYRKGNFNILFLMY
ncbi:hypothetical protein CULT_1780002 [[Clostridium] ultunense Esp]|nr:hypothetical protein CULT_1780002 [[Clostridium] ultunense Esp]